MQPALSRFFCEIEAGEVVILRVGQAVIKQVIYKA